MSGMTVLLIGVLVILMMIGAVGYLLIIASSRAEQTEARVRALLREAPAGRQPPVT